jgi:hypothetical protein
MSINDMGCALKNMLLESIHPEHASRATRVSHKLCKHNAGHQDILETLIVMKCAESGQGLYYACEDGTTG